MINKIKRYFQLRKAIKRCKLLASMVDSIDRAFVNKRISRKVRRQFWDDFVNSKAARKKFIEDMGRNDLQAPK